MLVMICVAQQSGFFGKSGAQCTPFLCRTWRAAFDKRGCLLRQETTRDRASLEWQASGLNPGKQHLKARHAHDTQAYMRLFIQCSSTLHTPPAWLHHGIAVSEVRCWKQRRELLAHRRLHLRGWRLRKMPRRQRRC